MQETPCVRTPKGTRGPDLAHPSRSEWSLSQGCHPSQMPTHWLCTTGQTFKRPQLWRPEVQNRGVTGLLPARGSERETVASCSPGGCWRGLASLDVWMNHQSPPLQGTLPWLFCISVQCSVSLQGYLNPAGPHLNLITSAKTLFLNGCCRGGL